MIYYISFSGGNDANSGLTEALAWKTATNFNAASFAAGDQIKFKCGDTWSEHFIVPTSGASGNSITISSYGTGAKPLFSSLVLTATWTSVGGGVYSTAGGIGSIYAFVWEGNKSLTRATSSACTDGQWYYGSSTTYYKPTSGTPSDHVISYARLYGGTGNYMPAFNVSDRSYIKITGLQFQRCAEGITSWDSGAGTTSIEVSDCDFYYCQDGVFLMPDANHNTGALIHNNYFKWCHNGIRFYCTLATTIGTSTASQNKNCKIYANEMDACGTIDGTTLWWSGYGTDYEAIGLNNIQSCEVYDNYIHGGYQLGVNVWNIANQYSRNNLIYRNYIKDSSHAPISFDSNPTSIGFSGNWVYNNKIVNCGSNSGFTFNQGLSEVGMNYFLNNTVIGNWAGFKLYTTYNTAIYLTIQNNIFYNTNATYSRINGVPTNLVCDYNFYLSTSGSPYFLLNSVQRSFAYFQGLGYEAHGQVVDPLLNSDYSIQATSPAKNAGVNTGLTTDYAGHTRTLPIDIGALEYFVSSTGTTTKIKFGASFIKHNGIPLKLNS